MQVAAPSAGATIVLFERVSEPANVLNVPVVGSVTPVVLVAVRVIANAPEVMRLPVLAIVSVADAAGCVIVTLLIVVAVAEPSIGATIVLFDNVSVVARPTKVSVAS